jgi:hypothetical protein
MIDAVGIYYLNRPGASRDRVPPRNAGAREQHRKAFNTEKLRGPRSATGVSACTACGGHRRRIPALRRRALKGRSALPARPSVTLAGVVSPPSWPGLDRPASPCLGLVTEVVGGRRKACPRASLRPDPGAGHGGRRGAGGALVARPAPMRPFSASKSARHRHS